MFSYKKPNTKYYWKVGDKNKAEGYTYYEWSEVWNFTTGNN